MVGSEIEERSKDNVQSQAGRTLDTFPSKTESPTLAHSPPNTTVDNTFQDPDTPFTHAKHLHNAQLSTTCEKHSDEEAEQFKNGTFSKPLKESNREASHIAHVSSLRAEYSDKFEPSPVVTEMKSNGASVKKILAEFEKFSSDEANKSFTNEQEKANIDALIEENYMPMSPKRNILAPRSSVTSDTITLKDFDSDENHYVEMTKNTMSVMSENNQMNEQQPYETVCFTGSKMEPVYMELKNPERLGYKLTQDLPDILIPSKKSGSHSSKSDSSDADDEASKDLDSLDTPSQPRFSLSDTFRPASYYLGASRAGPEFHDSSDSDLVSPPPIPPYPPPSVSLGSTDEYMSCPSKITQLEPTKTVQDFYNFDKRNSNSSINTERIDNVTGFKRSFSIDKSDKDSKNSTKLSSISNDADVEMRFNSSINYSTDSMYKRRPLSEEDCNELESLSGEFVDESAQSVELERFMEDLPICNMSITSIDDTSLDVRVPTAESSNYDYENLLMRAFPNDTNMTKFSDVSSNVFEEDAKKDINGVPIFPNRSVRSASANICGIRDNSACSTPIVDMDFLFENNKDMSIAMYITEQREQSFCPVPAPYYYSDLNISSINSNNSVLTLNNQREANFGSKKDITHIINPIKCNSLVSNSTCDSLETTFKLAAEARSASVDFLNLTDKSGNIDEKNIYESNTLKWQKTTRTDHSLLHNSTTRNLNPVRPSDKFSVSDMSMIMVRRSQSLEGLLENVAPQTLESINAREAPEVNQDALTNNLEGSYVWEEDSIWRERLRTASQRHTKSMEDIDTIGDENRKKKKNPRGITRDVTYVNDNFFKVDKQQKEIENENALKNDNDKKEGNFIIDREKLRQWDLLSSAPSDDQLSTVTAVQALEGNNVVVEIGEGEEICDSPDIADPQETGICFNFFLIVKTVYR